MRRRTLPTALIFSLSIIPATAQIAWATVHFQGLGFAPGAENESYSFDISGDGSTVTAWAHGAAGGLATRWTASTGMVSLSSPDHLARGWATGASFDGSIITGFDLEVAFRWTATTGATPLHVQSQAISSSYAFDVSADGSVIVGYANSNYWLMDGTPFIWTETNGMSLLDPSPAGYSDGIAFSVSSDGTVLVGRLQTFDPQFPDFAEGEAFYWSPEAGFVTLGQLNPSDAYLDSFAYGVSHDGSVIVGYAYSTNHRREAFRWTAAGGMQGLGFLPGGGGTSYAFDCSEDGSVVVGRSSSASGNDVFVWDATYGMRSLTDILTSSGVNLTGWQFNAATGVYVSADGTRITAMGINPSGQAEAWLAVIPEPATLSLLMTALPFLGRRRVA